LQISILTATLDQLSDQLSSADSTDPLCCHVLMSLGLWDEFEDELYNLTTMCPKLNNGDDWSFMSAIGLHAKLSANVISINRS